MRFYSNATLNGSRKTWQTHYNNLINSSTIQHLTTDSPDCNPYFLDRVSICKIGKAACQAILKLKDLRKLFPNPLAVVRLSPDLSILTIFSRRFV